MEDRYLFKAKRIDNGEWVQGYLFYDGFENGRIFIGGLVIEKYNGTACDDWNVTGIDFCEVDPSTICQCTGLKDKNGKLIWENDIVRDEYGNFYKAFWQNDYYQFSFCAKTGVFPIGAKWNLWSFKSSEIEVVGNIFDNKESLESEG
mgnify:CR=1 FL=1|jgi:uncharacterized phage protein (TIGR01671 family)